MLGAKKREKKGREGKQPDNGKGGREVPGARGDATFLLRDSMPISWEWRSKKKLGRGEKKKNKQ